MSKSAQVQDELLKLKKGGVILPADVVDAARDPQSVLHDLFTWDDGEAAHQYRLEQARRVLRTYVVIEDAPKQETVRAFVSLSSDRRHAGGGYRHITDVLSDEELYRRMLADSLAEIRAFRQKYERIKELRPVFDAADEVEKGVEQSGDGTLAA